MVSVAFKNNLKGKCEIKSNNEDLLEDAFTHPSYANEHPEREDYERLELLGDTILELAVSDYLYRHFPRLNEDGLTRMHSNIIRTEGFSELAIEYGLPAEVNLGKGEGRTGARRRKALLEDVFGAFNGALFLDQGMPAVQHFLHLTVYPLIAKGGFNASRDCKTEPQGRLQVNEPVKIEYQVIAKDESEPYFKMQLLVNGKGISEGQGRSKKAAEQQAVQATLDKNR